METITEINAALADLVKAMSAKGVVTPAANLTIRGTEKPYVSLWSAFAKPAFGGEYLHTIYGDNPDDAASRARSYINALPDPAAEGERKFTRKLAEAVDIATEYSLPDKVVAPVKAAILQVNEALLTGPAS